MNNEIKIRGARTHNLKNINLDIPREKLVVLTGLSGSGKSSLAFDTLYAEGQRRYVESLSAYARQFLQLMEKPDVDVIEGLSPAISIEQKATSHNPRSTVGTVTEIHDYLRLLFARAGTPHCPEHNLALAAQSVSQMVDTVMALPPETKLMILAPVVSERKGEFVDLFQDLQAQGFVRFRVRSGGGTTNTAKAEIFEVDQLPKLKKTDKHSIEVVVDRIKVRPDIQQRLAESFETALRLADGKAMIVDMDTGVDTIFSSKFACPICSYSLQELEPRLFSFNNPMGACPSCDGLGHISFFDPKRIVAHPDLSLASGAIKGWDRRNQFYFKLLQTLAKHAGFDIEKPFENLPKKAQDLVLMGSGDTNIAFEYLNERGKLSVRQHPFEGIVANFERRYRETESMAVREELSRYQNVRSCPDCNGTRLRREARFVKVGDGKQSRGIFEISALPLKEAKEYFETLQLKGAKREIADKIVKEISSRLTFLNDVGLDYLSLERSADTLSGGEAQRIRLASQIGSGLTGVMYVLDEPSIGLHQRDNDRLIGTLKHLRDLGNSVLVVEHDEDMIRASDHVIDIGPGAGVHGGRVVAQGTPAEVEANPNSLTGAYLAGRERIEVPEKRIPV
jgi:excinuclease ABC subunit A